MLLHYARDEVYDIYHSFTDEGKGIGTRQFINGVHVPQESEKIKHSLTEYFTQKTKFLKTIKILTGTVKIRKVNMNGYYTGLWTQVANFDFHNAESEFLAQIIQT